MSLLTISSAFLSNPPFSHMVILIGKAGQNHNLDKIGVVVQAVFKRGNFIVRPVVANQHHVQNPVLVEVEKCRHGRPVGKRIQGGPANYVSATEVAATCLTFNVFQKKGVGRSVRA